MAQRPVVIVSGETDRRAILKLLARLPAENVRKPPGNAPLTPDQAKRLIKAAWYEMGGRGAAPDKFVVLIDADAHEPADAARPFEEMAAHLSDVGAPRLVAVAVRHLEAWFFAHREKLREYLDRDLGSVDPTQPDRMDSPKLHLIHLLKSCTRVYTSLVAEQIAARLDPTVIAARSPSFARFLGSLDNGAAGVGRSPSPSSTAQI